MKKIIAEDKLHLKNLIDNETRNNGYNCDLNHIDVSQVTDMCALFEDSKFNGNISNWNVSKVKNMSSLFSCSFFNGDISKWDVSNVEYMNSMFYASIVNQDLSCWRPLKIKQLYDIFFSSLMEKPYWAKINDIDSRNKAIEKYSFIQELNKELVENKANEKRLKI